MLLYNQSKNRLKWDMSGRVFECDPWGPIEMPDDLIEHCKKRGLPLGVNQVAPEFKASASLAAAADAAREDDVVRLRRDLGLAEVALKAAADDLEKERFDHGETKRQLAAAGEALAEKARTIDTLTADKAASEQLLAETAWKLTEAENRTEVALAEAKKTAIKAR